MTRKQWNKRFRKALRSLPASERNAAAEYYDELYGDKRDAGMSEEAITAEFGDPEDAARRIADEAGVAAARPRRRTRHRAPRSS